MRAPRALEFALSLVTAIWVAFRLLQFAHKI
jgi:hypothetical protein